MHILFTGIAGVAAALVVGSGLVGATTPPVQHDLSYTALVAAAQHTGSAESSAQVPPTQIPLKEASVRGLGMTPHRQYFVAESEKGLICLVSHSSRAGTMTGCTTPPRFYREGVEIMMSGTPTAFTAYLAPAGVDTSALASRWTHAGGDVHTLGPSSSLVVTLGDTPSAGIPSAGTPSAGGTVTLHRADGPAIQVRSEPTRVEQSE